MRSCAVIFFVFALTSFGGVIDQSFTSPTNAVSAINECCAFIGQTYTAGLSGTLAGLALDIGENRRVSIALRHSQMEFTEFYSLRVC